HRNVVPGDDAVHDALLRREVVERALVLEAYEIAAEHALLEVLVRKTLDGDPFTGVAAPVLGVRVHGGRDVRWQRPRRRRPDDRGLGAGIGEGEAQVERRMLDLLVVLLARLLVLRERRAAARAPLRRAMALVQPAALVHDLEEPPDVVDVRVREGVVVVAPVHPHAKALRLSRLDAGEVGDEIAAAPRELGDAVLL